MDYRIKRPEKELIDSKESNDTWEQRTLRELLLEVYGEQRKARLWRNIWRGAGVLMFLSMMTLAFSGGSDNKKKQMANMERNEDHTAVIDLKGVISDGEMNPIEVLRDGMEEAYKNKKVKAILIRANSPGGSPVMSNIAFEELRRLKAAHADIPVYVVVEDMCASGCYYIASAADKIYADPSSLVGSIGVIGSSFDATELMAKLGIKRRQRIAGNNKDMGDPFSPETPEQAAIWQQMLNQIHGEFIKAVKEGRGHRLQEANNPDLFSGRVYTGIEGKKVGLIDDFGNIYSVSRDVIKAPKLVDYTPQDDDLMRLISKGLGTEMKGQVHHWLNKMW